VRALWAGPRHTHAGFGFANRDSHVRLCEIYVARHVAIDPCPTQAAPLTGFVFSGRLLDQTYSVKVVDVYYEPLPQPRDVEWLRILRPYGLPEERETLMPKLGRGYEYEDGSKGSIELLRGGRFKVPILLGRKQPGIYTVVVWIQRSPADTPFAATQVCVRAE